MNEQQWAEKLPHEGFTNLAVCPNGPNTEFGEHTHEQQTVHVILEGEFTLFEQGDVKTLKKRRPVRDFGGHHPQGQVRPPGMHVYYRSQGRERLNMVDVKTEILIKCPRSKVSEYVSNPDNAPKWYVNIQSVEWKTPKPLVLGSQIAFTAQFLGRRLSYAYEIIEFVPAQKLVMRTSSGPFVMETTYLWESRDDKTTRMTLRNRGNPTGFSKFLAPFLSLALKRENEKDLRRLKEIMERT